MSELPAPAKAPCHSCPYRRDVPSGIWHPDEYAKLPAYDGQTWEQPMGLFLCHQADGHLCAGWLACHDTAHLLALRIHPVAPEAFGYASPVPVFTFTSGAEAAAHGMAEVAVPGASARQTMARLKRKRRVRVAPTVERADNARGRG